MRASARVITFLCLSLSALILGGCDQFEDPDIAQILSIDPDSGAVGTLVVIGAENLLNNTRVVFHDEITSELAALFLDRVVTIVPSGATSGDVVLETGGERSSSRREFTIIPAPPSTPAFFEDDTGTAIELFNAGCTGAQPGDDGFAASTLPFSFPFYGRPQTDMFVTTNGLISFGEPRPCDNSGTRGSLTNGDRIAVLNFDLEPGLGGRVLVNATNPERVVVTWSEVPLCRLEETSNTFQAILFPDGRVRLNFGYVSTRGIASRCLANNVSGSVTGIAPLAPTNLVQVAYTVQPTATAGPQEAIFDVFFVDRFFNLENRSLLFTPLAEAGVFSGYRVELLPPE